MRKISRGGWGERQARKAPASFKSVREGGAILRGQRKASRRFELGSSGIRAIRERTSLS
jgi:hypothetical protein